MEANDFFPNSKTPKPYDHFENNKNEEMPIKKVLSLKLNIPKNFVPILKPKRVSLSSKEVHFFSLDNDDTISSDSENEDKTKFLRKKESEEKRRNSLSVLKNHTKQISHFEEHHERTKKSLFFTHIHKTHEIDTTLKVNENIIKDFNKLEIICDNNEDIKKGKDNENTIESFVL